MPISGSDLLADQQRREDADRAQAAVEARAAMDALATQGAAEPPPAHRFVEALRVCQGNLDQG